MYNRNDLPAAREIYLQNNILFFGSIEYSGMLSQRGAHIINNVIAAKIIILI